jgi:drug/metabolite transporter (DMT)-like permease
MDKKLLTANALLLLCAAIWGFAFVAQRAGMEHVGPFIFNGIRFLLGTVALIPFLIFSGKSRSLRSADIFGGIAAGTVLFIAVSFQQVSVVYTTAGNAGFITGLYIIIVPFLSHFFLKHRIGGFVWTGAGLALAGLYLLSITGTSSMEKGALFALFGAFFWALHILVIGHFATRAGTITLAAMQFLICSLFSFTAGLMNEPISQAGIIDAAVPLLYAGLLSTGVAFMLQIVGQKIVHASHASIIMSMESLFAALGGWWLLGEGMTFRALTGCALMFLGMVVSQKKVIFSNKM